MGKCLVLLPYLVFAVCGRRLQSSIDALHKSEPLESPCFLRSSDMPLTAGSRPIPLQALSTLLTTLNPVATFQPCSARTLFSSGSPTLAPLRPLPMLDVVCGVPSARSPCVLMAKGDQKLRSEVDNALDPYQGFRLVAFPVLFAAAGLAFYFAATSLLAEASNLRPASPETLPNLGISIAALATIGFFWKRELDSKEKREKKAKKDGQLANLRLEPLGGPKAGRSIRLKDLRPNRKTDPFGESARRIMLCAAEEQALLESLAAARPVSSSLVASDLMVVPLLLQTSDSRPEIGLPPRALILGDASSVSPDELHLGVPQNLELWQEVMDDEIDTAMSKDSNVVARGLTVVLEKSGRISSRRLGLPDWKGFANDAT